MGVVSGKAATPYLPTLPYLFLYFFSITPSSLGELFETTTFRRLVASFLIEFLRRNHKMDPPLIVELLLFWTPFSPFHHQSFFSSASVSSRDFSCFHVPWLRNLSRSSSTPTAGIDRSYGHLDHPLRQATSRRYSTGFNIRTGQCSVPIPNPFSATFIADPDFSTLASRYR